MTTREATLEVLNPARCESIIAVAAFQPTSGPARHYLNLRHSDRGFRGDANTKLWVDDRGALIYQPGKGTCSYPFREDRDAVLELAKASGIEVEKRS